MPKKKSTEPTVTSMEEFFRHFISSGPRITPEGAVQAANEAHTRMLEEDILGDDLVYPMKEEEVLPTKTNSVRVRRKLPGHVVICERAMDGKCPVLLKRLEDAENLDFSLASAYCKHMVPHTHQDNECEDIYYRAETVPRWCSDKRGCREAQCSQMQMVPEHLQFTKQAKQAKPRAPKKNQSLPAHKRTLILD